MTIVTAVGTAGPLGSLAKQRFERVMYLFYHIRDEHTSSVDTKSSPIALFGESAGPVRRHNHPLRVYFGEYFTIDVAAGDQGPAQEGPQAAGEDVPLAAAPPPGAGARHGQDVVRARYQVLRSFQNYHSSGAEGVGQGHQIVRFAFGRRGPRLAQDGVGQARELARVRSEDESAGVADDEVGLLRHQEQAVGVDHQRLLLVGRTVSAVVDDHGHGLQDLGVPPHTRPDHQHVEDRQDGLDVREGVVEVEDGVHNELGAVRLDDRARLLAAEDVRQVAADSERADGGEVGRPGELHGAPDDADAAGLALVPVLR